MNDQIPVAHLDPPKESTAPALRALAEHGVSVKVLTGDNELVTAKICRQAGLPAQGILLGYMSATQAVKGIYARRYGWQ